MNYSRPMLNVRHSMGLLPRVLKVSMNVLEKPNDKDFTFFWLVLAIQSRIASSTKRRNQ